MLISIRPFIIIKKLIARNIISNNIFGAQVFKRTM